MKNVCAFLALVTLCSCGSAAEIAAALRETPVPAESQASAPGIVWTATPAPATPRVSNDTLQVKLLGQWDIYSRNCQGTEFSFEFLNDGTCYMFQKYGQRYKCSWTWIDAGQIKLCMGADCRTDMYVSFSDDMLRIHTSKCDTEYVRPDLMK